MRVLWRVVVRKWRVEGEGAARGIWAMFRSSDVARVRVIRKKIAIVERRLGIAAADSE